MTEEVRDLLVLDCSSMNETVLSISRITGTPVGSLLGKLKSITWESLSDSERTASPFSETLVQRVLGDEHGRPVPESVHWFHATRIRAGSDFKEGLRPTSMIRGELEEFLRVMAADLNLCLYEDWPKLARTGHDAWRLSMKSGGWAFDDGPHGFLVRETLLDTRGLSIPDYADAPEYILEVCRAIPEKVGGPLLEAFKAETRPALIKFRSKLVLRRPLNTAICYAHAKVHSEPLSSTSCLGYGGEGKAIPREDILGIEMLDEQLAV